MSEVERRAYRFLLILDTAAILIAMVAGPLDRTAVAIGAAASALLISACLLAYGLWVWRR